MHDLIYGGNQYINSINQYISVYIEISISTTEEISISTNQYINTIPPPGLQPSYNSGSTEPIRKIDAPFDSGGAILSAVSKMVTVGDLGDLERSRGQLSLLQPCYNSGSTAPIATSSTSFDSAYAISSSVSKLVTLGDLCDLKMALCHFCLQLYCSHPITQNLLCQSRRARRHSIQHMRFHRPFRSRWPTVTSVTFRGRKVTFAYGSHPITQHLLSRSRRAWRHSIQHMQFHQPFRSWWPSVTPVTFRGQKVTFPYGSHPITQHLLGRLRRAWRHSIQRICFHQPFRSWWPWVTSVSFRGQKITFPHGSHPITQHLLGRSRRAWRHSIRRMRFHQPFRSWRPSVTSVTFRGQKVTFAYGSHPITQHLLGPLCSESSLRHLWHLCAPSVLCEPHMSSLWPLWDLYDIPLTSVSFLLPPWAPSDLCDLRLTSVSSLWLSEKLMNSLWQLWPPSDLCELRLTSVSSVWRL